ncbi:MAG: hypothetical protein HC850_10995 [Rhodomicrobium sp.]|nr:hypothetical protein [Rhodomicrobium sp.]
MKQFQTSVQGANQQNGLQADATIDQQAQNFVSLADTSGDLKVNADELAASLNISGTQAQNYVNAFNTAGDTDNALDATEITAALQATEQPTQPEEAAPSGTPPEGTPPEGTPPEGKPPEGTPPEGAAPEETPPASAAPSETPPSSSAAPGGMSGLSDLWKLLLALLDADGDGKISPEELKKFVEKYDKNGDGKLDKTELKEGLQAEAEAKGVELSDSDLEKMTTQIDTLFENADTNTDGALDNTELSGAITQLENLQTETAS